MISGGALSKSTILKRFAELFGGGEESDDSKSTGSSGSGVRVLSPIAQHIVICYSGAGARGTGNWRLNSASESEAISFSEIWSEWSKSRVSTLKGAHLTLFLDSCFSAEWITAARAATTSSDAKHPIAITIQCATLARQPSLDHCFTGLWEAVVLSKRTRDSVQDELQSILGPTPTAVTLHSGGSTSESIVPLLDLSH